MPLVHYRTGKDGAFLSVYIRLEAFAAVGVKSLQQLAAAVDLLVIRSVELPVGVSYDRSVL